MSQETTQATIAIEAVRAILRALPTDDDRARVLHAITAPPTEGDVRKRINDALAAAGTVDGAAKLLGVGRRTLMDKMRDLGGFPPRPVGRKRKLI
jgi:transcriptional regulator with GAF, ATPase, and Fis domain